jgi:hypothetical protein
LANTLGPKHLKFMRIIARLLGLGAVLGHVGVASGHGLSAGVAEVQLRGNTAFVVIAPRAELFLETLDGNHDGLISGDEVQVLRAVLQERFERSFRVRDGEGREPKVTFFDVGVPTNALPDAPAYVRFTAQLQWSEIPSALEVASEWGPLQLEVVRVQASAPGEWIAMGPAESVVVRGDSVPTPPLVVVSPRPSHRPWALPLASALAAAALLFSIRRRQGAALQESP